VTEFQKRASSYLAALAMGALATTMVFFAIAALFGLLRAELFPGMLFSSLSDTLGELNGVLKGTGVIVLFGAGAIGSQCSSTRQTAAISACLCLGILASVALLFAIDENDFTRNIHELTGRFRNNDDFITASHALLQWAGGGLVASLVAFLGFTAAGKKSDA
jgi:hypothetical protein